MVKSGVADDGSGRARVLSRQRATALCGLYLAAAELARRGFAVSPAFRGKYLRVMGDARAASVLAKVHAKTAGSPAWRLDGCRDDPRAVHCVHVFVDLGTAGAGELFAVPAADIARLAASPACRDGLVRKAALRPHGGGNAWRAFGTRPRLARGSRAAVSPECKRDSPAPGWDNGRPARRRVPSGRLGGRL